MSNTLKSVSIPEQPPQETPRQQGRQSTPAFRHILITRYNITSSFGIKAGIDPVDPVWLDHRATLFERFCAPSIRRQTTRDFEWVLLVNPDTPESYLATLRTHARLIFASSLDDAVNQLAASVADDGRLLITSRIDNDDAVVPEYLAKARRMALRFHTGKRSAVAFSHGVRVNLETSRARQLQIPRSPFSTLVETAPPWRSISWYPHTVLDNAMPLTSISTAAPMWLQTLHGRNVANGENWDLYEKHSIEAGHYAAIFPELKRLRCRQDRLEADPGDRRTKRESWVAKGTTPPPAEEADLAPPIDDRWSPAALISGQAARERPVGTPGGSWSPRRRRPPARSSPMSPARSATGLGR